ncbi:MAG: peptidoglycan bridge formation glycyltransferase FemA/FemB family protein [Actinomycetaceae bacterium]|nr:peptidoglycan bridge formation glycyltransferase FemA/FemB family protein [Actinomycetaceae bacterium]
MRFVHLSESEYQAFVRSQDRFFYTQLPSYAAVRRSEGYDVDFFGLVDDSAPADATSVGAAPVGAASSSREPGESGGEANGKSAGEAVVGVKAKDGGRIVGVASIVFRPWKRFFRRAIISYGPHLDWSDREVVSTFFTKMRDYLAKERNIVSVRVNPPLERRYYEDITPSGANPDAALFDSVMKELGAIKVNREFYESADIQMRYIYTKDLGSMTFDEAVASCGQVVRTGFHRHGTNGVEVRMLEPSEFEVFEKLMEHTAQRTDMSSISSSAFGFYRDLAAQLYPDECMMPAAVLDCDKYLSLIADERATIAPKVAELEEHEAAAEAEGRKLGKKQRNALKEHRARLDVLARREDETRAIKEAEGNEVILAASFFVHSPNELVNLLSGAYSQYQSYYGIYLIHRAMFEWAIEHGVRWYNFFGITGDFSEDASDAGVLHFKRQFHGNVEEFVGTYDLPVRPVMARAVNAVG